MNRQETRKHLDAIKSMSDAEIAANAELVREVAQKANMHLALLAKAVHRKEEGRQA